MPKKKLNRHYLIDRNDIIHANKLGITFGRHIGSGMYADVFYCKYNDRRVALKATVRSKCVRKTFDTEIQVSNILKVNLQIMSSHFLTIVLNYRISLTKISFNSWKCFVIGITDSLGY